ncbi:outer membrane lipoprotein [uncultured Caudovirales phage]|uniref:Outer membrane lipoprotein n=1 Tax=uncultured Caudovirales phage TaxID=2100421 RepID=A0A6J5KV34_9CAUD|nr:outer membrane lipoprotein [uncultured Caudovirales phage]
MKKLIAIGAIALVMTSCASTGVSAVTRTSAVVHQQVERPVNLIQQAVAAKVSFIQTAIETSNTAKVNKVISQLKGQVHKTWYVFSGDTPRGWDCSGMTMWAYGQLGVNLEHRASKQKYEGTLVKTPKFGDIVAFTYKGSQSAYHVGIYLSPDEMIHAGGGKGDYTSIVRISKFAGKYSNVTYTRILQTL